MKLWGLLLIPLLWLAGCGSFQSTPDTLAGWQAVARQRNLAGESAAKLSRCQQLAANDRRRQELPDLLRLVRNSPDETAAELAFDILREAVAVASFRLIPENETLLSMSAQICAGEIDCLTAIMLAEKSYLESDPWRQPEFARREAELHRELTVLLGKVPDTEVLDLVVPQKLPDTVISDLISENYGNDPAALLKFANVILALPGEFARQLAADPKANIYGIWQEARWHAAVGAANLADQQLSIAYKAWLKDASPQNLYRYRKWFYRRQLALSAIPLVRGVESDYLALDALMQLHNYL